MNATRPFSLANVAHALCVALVKLSGAPQISARILAEAVAEQFPNVPLAALRVIAASVLRLHFEYPSVADMQRAGLDIDDEVTASRYFGEVLLADAKALEKYREGRKGGNVVKLDPAGPR